MRIAKAESSVTKSFKGNPRWVVWWQDGIGLLFNLSRKRLGIENNMPLNGPVNKRDPL